MAIRGFPLPTTLPFHPRGESRKFGVKAGTTLSTYPQREGRGAGTNIAAPTLKAHLQLPSALSGHGTIGSGTASLGESRLFGPDPNVCSLTVRPSAGSARFRDQFQSG